MLDFQLKKQTLISSFPTVAPILSAPLLSKTPEKVVYIHHLHTPPPSDCLALHKPGTGHGQPLTYNTGTRHFLCPLSLAFGLQSQPREKESQCIIWPSRSSNSGTQLDSLSFFFPIVFKVLIPPFLPLYLNICHHQSFLVLNAFRQLWVWGIEAPKVTASIYLQCPGRWCEWMRLLEEAGHK